MKTTSYALDNGAKLITLCNPHVHSVNIGFYFKGGAVLENKKVSGINHLLEHLFFRKLGDVRQEQLYAQINRMGGVFRGCTYHDFVRFDFTLSRSNDFFIAAFQLLIKLLDDFKWSDEEIMREKAVVLKQIQIQNTSSFIKDTDNKYLKNSGFDHSIMGTAQSVQDISTKDIHDWKNKLFQPWNLCCVLTGGFTDTDVEFAKYYLAVPQGGINNGFNEDRKEPKNFGSRDGNYDWIVPSEYDISDIRIFFDVDLKKNNEYTISILTSLLGQGDGSRLSVQLRENNALTDEVFTNVDEYSCFARICIEFAVFNEDLEKSLNIVFKEIKHLKDKITEADLASCQTFFTTNQFFDYDNVNELNFLLGLRGGIQNKSEITPNDLSEKYKEVTAADLQKAANNVFCSNNLTICVTNNSRIFKRTLLKKKLSELRGNL